MKPHTTRKNISTSTIGTILKVLMGTMISITVSIGIVLAINTISDGYRINSGSSTTIDAHGQCAQVSSAGYSTFVPTKTPAEWLAFRSSSSGITPCTYTWITGGYGACDQSCGPGTQYRSVSCQRHDGAIVADAFCGAGKPTASQSCNLGSCACIPNGSCSAASPACGTTTYGTDNCGNSCSRAGAACACVPNGSCSAASPACGTTTYGTDNCGNSCSRAGVACTPPPPVCVEGTTWGENYEYMPTDAWCEYGSFSAHYPPILGWRSTGYYCENNTIKYSDYIVPPMCPIFAHLVYP